MVQERTSLSWCFMPIIELPDGNSAIQTLDNTQTMVLQYDVSPDSAFIAELSVVAHRPSNGDWRIWRFLVFGHRDGSGGVSVSNPIALLSTQGNIGSVGWALDVVINGIQNYTLDILVTGPNATVNWAARMVGTHVAA